MVVLINMSPTREIGRSRQATTPGEILHHDGYHCSPLVAAHVTYAEVS
jgi:hypothetical protein